MLQKLYIAKVVAPDGVSVVYKSEDEVEKFAVMAAQEYILDEYGWGGKAADYSIYVGQKVKQKDGSWKSSTKWKKW